MRESCGHCVPIQCHAAYTTRTKLLTRWCKELPPGLMRSRSPSFKAREHTAGKTCRPPLLGTSLGKRLLSSRDNAKKDIQNGNRAMASNLKETYLPVSPVAVPKSNLSVDMPSPGHCSPDQNPKPRLHALPIIINEGMLSSCGPFLQLKTVQFESWI